MILLYLFLKSKCVKFTQKVYKMLYKKIEDRTNGLLFYGLIPPKKSHDRKKLEEIAEKQVGRISKLKIDGVVLYDIQDESSRTEAKRPFPFLETVTPLFYVQKFLHVLNMPIIIYRAVGKYTKEQTMAWLQNKDVKYSVFVGAASKKQCNHINIDEAYKLKKSLRNEIKLGGIAIPERHSIKKDEHERMFSKMQNGCEFFVTQAVYDVNTAKKFLDDYGEYMEKLGTKPVPIIFTLTPCGSKKTLEFMKWLGIAIPTVLEKQLLNSQDILNQSVQLSYTIFQELYHYGMQKGIPIGCNVESVAIKKAEIDASVKLLEQVGAIMKR